MSKNWKDHQIVYGWNIYVVLRKRFFKDSSFICLSHLFTFVVMKFNITYILLFRKGFVKGKTWVGIYLSGIIFKPIQVEHRITVLALLNPMSYSYLSSKYYGSQYQVLWDFLQTSKLHRNCYLCQHIVMRQF